MKLKPFIARNVLNVPGWRTNRKIVVFESDDWGSIRMPSKSVYEKMLNNGVPVDKCPYNRYDSLASEKDLQELFNVLIKYKDINDNNPVITANTVVANPDFDRIRESGFRQYYYEPFKETLKKYPNHQNSFSLWKKGIEEKLFFPQFHGREHVNVDLWLELLKSGNKKFCQAFDNGFWGLVPPVVDNYKRINIQASFDSTHPEKVEKLKDQIIEGLSLFEKIFGYRAESFIANNFIWDNALNPVLKKNGVEHLQGMKYQLYPLYDNKKRKKQRRYLGEKNLSNQMYLIRNSSFEPTQNPQLDIVGGCIREISNAFFWNKPAIISTHRINFIGYIDQTNRDRNLKLFDSLLKKILTKWPNVEFMTSVDLGSIIRETTK